MSVSNDAGYRAVPQEYQLRDNGIDPRLELFTVPRRNEVIQVASGCLSAIRTAFCVLGAPFTLCCMVTRVKPMHDTVVARCGVISEVLREPGPYCLNPCCLDVQEVFMGLVTEELKNLPINDSHGNPLIISAQFVSRVSDSVRARYMTANLNQFLKDQGGTALRNVCGRHPFDVEDHAECLRKHSNRIDQELKDTLQLLVGRVGITIESFMLTAISVEKHMEKLLLARQEAQAELIARKTIADGSAGIMKELVQNYKTLGMELSKEELNRFATQLTLILVNHGHTTLNLFEGTRTPKEAAAIAPQANSLKQE